MKILINSMHDDMHALAVGWALSSRGHETTTILTEDFPRAAASSIFIEPGSPCRMHWAGELLTTDFSAVWNRRLLSPEISQDVDPTDRAFALREARSFAKSFFHLLPQDVFEINPRQTRGYASSKAVQLTEAMQAGLRIPDTLMTNDPDHARAFAKKHNNRVVFKSFSAHCWIAGTSSYSNLTSVISDAHLNDDESVSLTPGIYQQVIDKKREFRITAMGSTFFVAEVSNPVAGVVDSRPGARAIDGTRMVSPALLEKCKSLMKRLGICFGCFDFAQDDVNTEPYFLEVNEMGQWLYIESQVKGFHMLDAFSEFLCSLDPNFEYSSSRAPLRYEEFKTTNHYASAMSIFGKMTREYNRSHNMVTVES